MAWSAITTPVAATAISSTQFGIPVALDLGLLAGASTTDARAASTIWTAATTNPVIGNGTLVSLIRQDWKWVDWQVVITMGSTTTFGGGVYQLALPATARNAMSGIWYGRAIDSGSAGYPITVDMTSTSLLTLRCAALTAGAVDRAAGATAPFTFGTGDIISVGGRYEAA